ncbi:MAG: sulfite exporter TauE/SafE family protein [Firmicutes bacterium]|nr:sulfite exporter TauE/SafE family protein [Bacillota bacterium]
MPLITLPLFLVVISTLANMLGIEGGSLVMPLLIYLYGITPELGSGAVVAGQVIGLGIGAWNFWRQRRIDFRLAGFILSATIPGTIIGSYLVPFVSSEFIKLVIAAILLLAGIRIVFLSHWKLPDTAKGLPRQLTDRQGMLFAYFYNRRVWAWPLFMLAGLFQGMSGTGIGVVQMPVLLMIMDIPAHIAVATSVFAMAIASVAATGAHMAFVRIPWKIVAYLIPGVLIGAQLGPYLSKRLHPAQIQKVLGYLLLGLGIIMAGLTMTGQA